MVNKRAVLIGCNYPGTNAELKGCINDVMSMKDILTNIYGFQASDITIMIDTDPSTVQPTGKNIKAKLAEMVTQAQDGDELLVHYSGHGSQVPSDDPEETDGKDEVICPCDMNVIADGDLRAIFKPLSSKGTVKLTFVADCCHSGTLLDHERVIITGPKAGGPPPPNVDIQAIQGMLAALGGKDLPMKNRALPFNDLCGMLMSMLGGQAGANGAAATVGKGNFHETIAGLFGADASAKSIGFAQYAQYAKMGYQLLQSTGMIGGGAAGGAAGGGSAGGLAALCGMCFGGGAGTGAAGSQYAVQGEQAGAAAAPVAKPPPAGAKPPVHDQLDPDIGILVTGCQDNETSADARPPNGAPHGALTNALVTVVKNHHAANPGYPLTYRNLVIGVREMLAKTGFAQSPCLECGEKWADSPFLVTKE